MKPVRQRNENNFTYGKERYASRFDTFQEEFVLFLSPVSGPAWLLNFEGIIQFHRFHYHVQTKRGNTAIQRQGRWEFSRIQKSDWDRAARHLISQIAPGNSLLVLKVLLLILILILMDLMVRYGWWMVLLVSCILRMCLRDVHSEPLKLITRRFASLIDDGS